MIWRVCWLAGKCLWAGSIYPNPRSVKEFENSVYSPLQSVCPNGLFLRVWYYRSIVRVGENWVGMCELYILYSTGDNTDPCFTLEVVRSSIGWTNPNSDLERFATEKRYNKCTESRIMALNSRLVDSHEIPYRTPSSRPQIWRYRWLSLITNIFVCISACCPVEC